MKIGDELFRYIVMGGIHRFIVLGVRQYEDSEQYEIEDQNCAHGWKCRLLVARNDYGKLHAIHMLNEDEDDRQRHWHTNDGFHFWPTVGEAKAEAYRDALRKADERVSNAEEALKVAKRQRDEMKSLLSEATP